MKVKKSSVVAAPAKAQTKGPKAAAHAAKRAVAAAAKTPMVSTTPTPEAAPTAQAAPTPEAASVKTPTGTRNVSRSAVTVPPFNGRHARIMEFQDFTFALNAAKATPLTDTELAAVWQREFPNAVTFNAKHVAGARRDFLVNRHSRTFAGWTAETACAQLAPLADLLTPQGIVPQPAKAPRAKQAA